MVDLKLVIGQHLSELQYNRAPSVIEGRTTTVAACRVCRVPVRMRVPQGQTLVRSYDLS